MKIAVPTRDNRVDDHFGHCEYYTIYTVENSKVVTVENLQAPQGCGCKPNIAGVLSNLGVTVMLAGNMGVGAYTVLFNHGIEVVRGCDGLTQDVVSSFLNNTIEDNGTLCGGHEEGHGHEGCPNH